MPYNYNSGPLEVGDEIIPGQTAVNCYYIAHRLARVMRGVHLPPELDPVRMILENPFLQSLGLNEPLDAGDLLFVAKAGIQEFRPIPEDVENVTAFKRSFPGPHVAVFTGDEDPEGDPLFVHANFEDRKVSVWPRSKFKSVPRYAVEYGIKRPVPLALKP